jgi:iron-sulfur cluster assembly accessory protein
MTTLNETHTQGVSLTAQAARKLIELKQNEDCGQWGVRFADQPGFCGKGYEYLIDFASCPEPMEAVFYSHGIPIFIPNESMPRLHGSTIDYHGHAHVDDRLSPLEKQGFIVTNPNVKGPCPCTCQRGFDA